MTKQLPVQYETGQAYLDINKPRQRQFRPRRKPMVPVVVVHTAENNPDFNGVDNGAENVANFIRTRTTYGSYHLIGDRDSIIRLQTNNLAVYHDRSSNDFTTSLSGAMQGVNWTSLSGKHREQWINSFVQMFVIQGRDLQRRGVGLPDARLLTRSQAHAGQAGFIGHGMMDPGRRTDPGRDFPWTEILTRYAAEVGVTQQASTGSIHLESKSDKESVLALQQALNKINAPGHNELVEDGLFGGKTEEAVRNFQEQYRLDIDGIVGPNTKGAIEEALVQLNKPKLNVAQVLHEHRYLNSYFERENIDKEVAVNATISASDIVALTEMRDYIVFKSEQYSREVEVLNNQLISWKKLS